MKKWIIIASVAALMIVLLVVVSVIGSASKDAGSTPPTQTEPTEPDRSENAGVLTLDALRQQLTAEGKVFAVAYLGMMPYEADTVWEYVDSLGDEIGKKMPFLAQIPETNMASAETYGEVYCLILADPDTTMEIYTHEADTDLTQLIYEGCGEDPFLLICNATLALETELVFTQSGGENIRWTPKLDSYMYVELPRYANGTSDAMDISPYEEMLLARYASVKAESGWIAPTKAELENTTWYCDGYTEAGNRYEYRVSFHENTADVQWNPGYGETSEYTDAQWSLKEDNICVLTMDFGEFAGVRKYDLLVNLDNGEMYIAVDVTEKTLTRDSEAQFSFLALDQSQPKETSPMDMVGRWERIQTEVDGSVEETPAGQVTITITGATEAELKITYTNQEFPENSYKNKAMSIVTDGDTMGFGHTKWIAQVEHVGSFGQTFALAIVEDMLVLRNDFVVDGAPGVSYETFRAVR